MTEAKNRYHEFDDRAREAFHRGRLDEAERLSSEAVDAARELQDEDLVDRAVCNRATVVMARGRWQEPLGDLRRILMATSSQRVSFLAAYNIARAYEYGKETKKGLFYARVAQGRAELVGDAEWRYGARHQIANFLTADSQFEEAIDTYRSALELLPEEERQDQHEANLNLSYCDLMTGKTSQALSALYRCLRRILSQGSSRLEALARQDLSLALLESGRPDLAERQASRALEIAEDRDEVDVVKNSLFLLGECAEARGERDEAFRIRTRLQNRFYPEQAELPWLLARVDARKLVNLRA